MAVTRYEQAGGADTGALPGWGGVCGPGASVAERDCEDYCGD